MSLRSGDKDVEINVDIKEAIKTASFPSGVTDVFWPREELYREGQSADTNSAEGAAGTGDLEDSEEPEG